MIKTTKEIYDSVRDTCAASDEFKPLMKKEWISKDDVKEIIDRNISNLEDMKGIGVPSGTNYTAIDHTLQNLYELSKEMNLDE